MLGHRHKTDGIATYHVAPKPLAGLRHLSFEAGSNCNLASEHPACPILRPDRWPDTALGSLTVDDILHAIDEAVALGFRGYVDFHYYNEPLLSRELIREVVESSSYDRFMLWSNGQLLSRDVTDNDILAIFEWVVLSDYDPERNAEWFDALVQAYPQVRIEPFTATFDSRLGVYDGPPADEVTCWRHRLELPVDHYGNVHLCCQDWRGSVALGNVKRTGLKRVVTAAPFATLSEALCDGTRQAPSVCRTCSERVSRESYEDLCREHLG